MYAFHDQPSPCVFEMYLQCSNALEDVCLFQYLMGGGEKMVPPRAIFSADRYYDLKCQERLVS